MAEVKKIVSSFGCIANIRLSKEIKEAVTKKAKSLNASDSEVVRAALINYLGLESDVKKVSIGDSETKKVSITMPSTLERLSRDRSKELGMTLSRYISSMLQANLTDFPVLHEKEIQALDECRTELRRIGNNVNQLSKHFNTTLNDFNPEGYKVFRALYKDVLNLKSVISDLIAASSGVYGRNRN